MHLSLKKKILIASLVVNLCLSSLLGLALYWFAGDQYYEAFLESKLSLARSLAMSIDGSKHATFTSLRAMNDPDYQRTLRYLNSVRTNEKYVSYLFTLHYDPARDRVSYIVDSDILVRDTVWITTEHFGLAMTIDANDRISLKYNEEERTKDFPVRVGEKTVPLQIRNESEIWIDNKRILSVAARNPLTIETPAGTLSRDHRERYVGAEIGGTAMQVYCTFSAAGESQSIPGEQYMESKEVVERCKSVIRGQAHTIVRRGQQTSIYGMNTATVYGVIKDARGVANGLVVFELFVREVSNFKLAMVRIVIIAAAVIFLVTLLLSNMLSRSLVTPIRRLTEGANRIREGDLDHAVEMERTDELGVLAESFNNMVSRLKTTQRELAATNAELTRANLLKDQFLANTSHELKTPLNGIIGIADSLIDGAAGSVNSHQAENLRLISLSGKRLFHLVNDILDFSKLKNRDISIDPKPVDIRQIAEIVIILCTHLVGKKPLRIVNQIEPHLPPVLGDEDRLQQIMYNLVGNAIKFSDAGTIAITAAIAGDSVDVTVSDTGIGIPADRFEDIFKYFEQLDAGPARRYGGTGLGLAITRQLVELHGGAIRVASTVGKGSAFTFSIPRADRAPAAEEIARPKNYLETTAPAPSAVAANETPAPAQKPKRDAVILVVDDEPVNVQVLVNILSLEGYRVLTAASGMEAIGIIQEKCHPDLVLLDIMMPRMTGYHVCSLLRESFSLYDLPVLMLTVKNQVQDMVAGFEAGANDYLTKPFDRRELLARVDTLLTLKNAVYHHNRFERIQRELEIARRIQNAILPETLPALPGLDIQVAYRPMDSVGGDFYDYHIVDDNRIGILIADVSGHSIPAALIASMIKIAFYMQSGLADAPDRLMQSIHNTLFDKCESHFITASYSFIDRRRGKLLNANAGHHPCLIHQRSRDRILSVKGKGRIIGLLPSSGYELTETDIAPGDRVVLFTDCILECRTTSGALFGEENFMALVRECAGMSPADFVRHVPDHLSRWSGNEGLFEDDMTIIVVDVK